MSTGTQPVSVHALSLDERVDRLLRNDPAVLQDPHRLFRDLREQSPVFRHRDKVLVTRYTDAREILVHPKVIQGLSVRGSRYRHAHAQRPPAEQQQLEEVFEFIEKRLAGANGDRHKRLRRLAQKAFTKRQVDSLQGRVQVIVDTILDDLPKNEPFDFIDEFSYHVPLIVICELLDVPVEGRERLRDWSSDLGRLLGADWGTTDLLQAGHNSLFHLREYLGGIFAAHRGADTTDLLASILAGEGEGEDQFTEDELVAMIVQFVFAGHETTTNLLSNALILLLKEHPDQWNLLVQDQALVPSAVEEILRMEGPTQMIDKIPTESIDLSGTTLHEGESLGVFLGAANRDPEAFSDPETFDIRRAEGTSIAFGFGAHHCIGASLARMEARIVLETLVDRFPGMRVATDHVTWQANHMLRGPERLDVVLEP